MHPHRSFIVTTIAAVLVLHQGAASANAPTTTTPDPAAANLRMQAVEGSLSAWSGQLNLLYKGSSLDHPFAKEAPNPGRVVPPPLVTASGTASTRYRLSQQTTFGLGTGIVTETPFQGPRHTTWSDPYIDAAHSWDFAGMHHRVAVQLVQWTNHAHYRVYGYRHGANVLAESLAVVGPGLTLGLQLAADANTFAEGDYPRSQQTEYGFGAYPSLEYRLVGGLDLRTVFGIRDAHVRSTKEAWRYQHPEVYQTIGLGFTVTRAFYVYGFVKGYPFAQRPFAADRTLCGFSTVINLF